MLKNNLKVFIDKSKLNKIINFISLIVILWSALIIISGIATIMINTVQGNIYSNTSLIFLQQKISRVHGSLLMVPMFIGLFMVFIKKLKLWHLAISIAGGFLLDSYQFLDHTIHPFLFSLHIYDFLLRSGQTILNPQYTKIFIFLVILIVLIIQSFIKKYRSVDRIFLSLIVSSVLVTTLIFHFALPMGMFKIAKKELENSLIEKIIFQDKKLLCEIRECFVLDDSFKIISQSNSANTETFKNYSFFIAQVAPQLNENNRFFSTSLGDFQGQGFDYIITVLEKTNDNYFLVYDKKASNKVSRHSEIWFAFLSATAHLIWVYGGLALLFLHKQVMFRKLSPRLNKES